MGMLLVCIWAIIGITAPITGYILDSIRGVRNNPDSKVTTGRGETRVTSMLIVIFTLPLLLIGIVLNYFEQL